MTKLNYIYTLIDIISILVAKEGRRHLKRCLIMGRGNLRNIIRGVMTAQKQTFRTHWITGADWRFTRWGPLGPLPTNGKNEVRVVIVIFS